MATVRLTKELQDDIKSKAYQGFKEREGALLVRYQQKVNHEELKADVLAVVLEQYGMTQELYDAVPNGWMPEVSELDISSLNDTNVRHILNNVKCDPKMKLPHVLVSSSYSRTFSLSDPRLQKYADLVKEHGERYNTLTTEKNTFISALNALFNRCTTLKQALELFPNLMELLPQYAIDRHNEKTEKRAKVQPTADGVNLDALSATLVRNKLHGAVAG